jgi:hypothetical protein
LVLVAAGFAGSAVYLYLPLRAAAHPAMNYAERAGVDLTTWSGFWWMLRGQMFESMLLGVPWRLLPAEAVRFVYWLWSNFLGLGCILGLVGIAEDRQLSTAVRRGLLLMIGGHLAFVLTYAVLDKDLMLVPVYVIWAVWLTLGAAPALRLISGWWRPLRFGPGALLLSLALIGLAINFRLVDVSGDWSARLRGEAILRAMDGDAVFIGSWADVPILEYLALVEGRRTDVHTVNVFFLHKPYVPLLAAEYLEAGRAVYTSVPALFSWRGFQLAYQDGCDCYRLGPPTNDFGTDFGLTAPGT